MNSNAQKWVKSLRSGAMAAKRLKEQEAEEAIRRQSASCSDYDKRRNPFWRDLLNIKETNS